MQLEMFADAPKPARTAMGEALVDIRLDIVRALAFVEPFPSNDALCLLDKVQEAGGCADFAKRDVPYALVQELRRHRLATFTYGGKRRLNEDEQTAKANGRLDVRRKLAAGAKKLEH